MKQRSYFTLPNGERHSTDSGHGKVLAVLIAAARGKRFPAGEKGAYPGELCPPGWVPHWTLTDLDVGGSSGDRRCRELINPGGLKIDVAEFKPASGEASSLTMRRIDLSTVPGDVLRAFGVTNLTPAFGHPSPVGEGKAPGDQSHREESPRSNRAEEPCDAGAGAPRDRGVEQAKATAFPPAPAPTQGPGEECGLAPLGGKIFFAPHRLQPYFEKEGLPFRPAYAVNLREHLWRENWDQRWRYSCELLLDVKGNAVSREQFVSTLKEMWRGRLNKASWRERFRDEIRGLLASGVVLIYGDHEPPEFRAAEVAADVLKAFSTYEGTTCEIAGDWPEEAERMAS